MTFCLEILAQDKCVFPQFLQAIFGYKLKVQTGAVAHSYDRLIIMEGIHLSAPLHTKRQAALYTAIYHCATGSTDFDNQFQPKAFCLHIMACHMIRPTHPPLSYHPNNTWR